MNNRYINQINSALRLNNDEIEQFDREGFLGPYNLFEKNATEQVLKSCFSNYPNFLLPNTLARHSVIPQMLDFATDKDVVNKVVSVLGEDVILWGSQIIEQMPNRKHRFHRDAEFE